MKRNILILLCMLVFTALLAACGGDKADEGTSAPTTEPTTIPADPTSEPTVPTTEPSAPTTEPSDPSTEPSEPTMPEYVTLQEYVPGSIELLSRDDDDLPEGRKYRWLYYSINYEYVRILSDEQRADWYEFQKEVAELTDYGKYREEMSLVTMIKRYNIPRETFQKAINSYVEMGEKLGYDFWHEQFEIPNLDIIYTFDNEIINRFYRYE